MPPCRASSFVRMLIYRVPTLASNHVLLYHIELTDLIYKPDQSCPSTLVRRPGRPFQGIPSLYNPPPRNELQSTPLAKARHLQTPPFCASPGTGNQQASLREIHSRPSPVANDALYRTTRRSIDEVLIPTTTDGRRQSWRDSDAAGRLLGPTTSQLTLLQYRQYRWVGKRGRAYLGSRRPLLAHHVDLESLFDTRPIDFSTSFSVCLSVCLPGCHSSFRAPYKRKTLRPSSRPRLAATGPIRDCCLIIKSPNRLVEPRALLRNHEQLRI